MANGASFAQGFMLDPGSPNSRFPQAASHDNLLEDNQAWGNDGYGLRVVGSNNNTVRGNVFSNNLQGVTLEQGSTGNTLQSNTFSGNQLYGVYLIGGSDHNTIAGNTVSGNGKHGIYIKTGGNTITQNNVSGNGAVLNGITIRSGISTLQETTAAAAVADFVLPGSTVSLAAADPDLIGSPMTVTISTS